MIKVQCSQCGHRLNAPDKLAGKKAKCPNCSAILAVPAAASAGADSPLLDALDSIESTPAAAPLPDGGRLAPMPNSGHARSSGGGGGLPMPLIIGGAAAGLIVVAVIIVVVVMQSVSGDSDPMRVERPPARTSTTAQAPAEQPKPEPAVVEAPPEPDPATQPTEQKPDGPGEGFVTLEMPDLEPVVEQKPEPEQSTDPATVFAQKFGLDLAKAKATPVAYDDAALARAIVEAAGEQGLSLAVVKFMLEKAFELGALDSSGYPACMTAMKRLVRLEPHRKLDMAKQAVAISEKYYGTRQPGAPSADDMVDRYLELASAQLLDISGAEAMKALKKAKELASFAENPPSQEIADRMDEAEHQIRLQARIDRLTEALEAKPDDKPTVQQLVTVYLYELDRPGRAVPYVQILADNKLISYADLATRPLRELTERQLLELAGWYAGLGGSAKIPNRPAMCIRARLYYEQYLAKHLSQDEDRFEALTKKNQVDAMLDDLGVGMKLARRQLKRLREAYGEVVIRPDVRVAIDKAIDWLESQQVENAHWEDPDPAKRKGHKYAGATALVAYALMMADENPRTSAPLRNSINWLFRQDIEGSYAACFRVHLWETLPEDVRQRNVAQRDVGRSMGTIFAADGSLDYWINKRPTKEGDLSTTLAGYLTMWLGETNGMVVHDGPWIRICKRLVEQQSIEGMWPYRPDRAATPSMTAAGLTILLMALDRNHLKDEPELRQQVVAAVDRGLYWMDTHYDPTVNMRWKNYYLAAVQHVGLLSGRRDFNGKNWYDATADHLIATQSSDGAWGNDDIVETAFAVAFLARGGNYYDVGGGGGSPSVASSTAP